MPIPVVNFQPLSDDQVSPLYGAASTFNELLRQQLANQLSRTKNQYAEPMFKEGLSAAKLENDISRVKAEYARPQASAELLKQQLENKWYEPNTRSEIGYRNAQANLANTQNQWYGAKAQSDIDFNSARIKEMPLKNIIDAVNAMRQNNRFNDAYQMSTMLKNMTPEARALWIAAHQDEYNANLNALANKSSQSELSEGQQTLVNALRQYAPDIASQSQQQPSQGQEPPAVNNAQQSGEPLFSELLSNQLQQLFSGNQQGQPQQPQATNNPRFSSSPEEIEQLKLANEMFANRKASGTKASNMAQFAKRADILNERLRPKLNEVIPRISRYAG